MNHSGYTTTLSSPPSLDIGVNGPSFMIDYAMIILKVHPLRKLIENYTIMYNAILTTLSETNINLIIHMKKKT